MRRLFMGALLIVLAAPVRASAGEIVVSAAASLTNAFREIGKRFMTAHPHDTVAFNFAASDVLLAQIAKGAPADVLASADEETMDRAQQRGMLAPGTRRDFAANRLVLVVPYGAPPLASIAALDSARVTRIAIGNPDTVPAGRYARAAIEAAGAWSALQPKLIYAQNVRQVLDYVARGEVDAGFVYRTDAAIMPERVSIAASLRAPREVRYPIAVVAASRQPELAAAFAGFVADREGRAVLDHFGFLPP